MKRSILWRITSPASSAFTRAITVHLAWVRGRGRTTKSENDEETTEGCTKDGWMIGGGGGGGGNGREDDDERNRGGLAGGQDNARV